MLIYIRIQALKFNICQQDNAKMRKVYNLTLIHQIAAKEVRKKIVKFHKSLKKTIHKKTKS